MALTSRVAATVAAVAVAGLVVAACGPARPHPDRAQPADLGQPAASAASVAPALPPDGRFDYQLGGAYPPARGVVTVSRDRTDKPARGLYNVCYVNAFQTQPQELAWWQRRHPGLLLRTRTGGYVTDPNWPDEVLLDTRTAAKRAQVAAIVGLWIDGCARSGFRAVEPDNLDSYTRSRGLLTASGNVALARLLVQRAHARRLAIAQKNTADLARVGRTRIGFDFAVAEECQVFDECALYAAAYGRHVLEIEYSDNGSAAFRTACAHRRQRGPVVYRDRDLLKRGERGYVFAAC